MQKIGIVTSKKIPELLEYDKDIASLFSNEGFNVKPILWDSDHKSFDEFDFLLMRTAWDYFLQPVEFKNFLTFLKASQKFILNPAEIMLENMHKFYLKNISDYGFDTIPTIFVEKNQINSIDKIINEIPFNDFIIKPAISGASNNTKLYNSKSEDAKEHLKSILKSKDALIQNYIPEIRTTGEYSNIFFNNGFSYTVLKKPVNGDYRVQKDFGGIYQKVDPPLEVFETSKKLAEIYLNECLYLRVDGVLTKGKFMIMEVEMIEPDLYMNIVPDAKMEFVSSFIKML